MHRVTQAAKLLNMSREWVYQLIAAGKLVQTEIGGVRFVVPDKRFKAIQKARAAKRKSGKCGTELTAVEPHA